MLFSMGIKRVAGCGRLRAWVPCGSCELSGGGKSSVGDWWVGRGGLRNGLDVDGEWWWVLVVGCNVRGELLKWEGMRWGPGVDG